MTRSVQDKVSPSVENCSGGGGHVPPLDSLFVWDGIIATGPVEVKATNGESNGEGGGGKNQEDQNELSVAWEGKAY